MSKLRLGDMIKKPSRSSQESKSLIIAAIPAFNEAKYIGTIVLKARQYVNEVVVVDDGSTDGTSTIARLAGATVIRNKKNKGYGSAVRACLAEAKGRNPDALVLLDADSQHDPDDIPRLIEPISEGYDIVIGSRKQQRGNIPRYRRAGIRVISHFSRVLSGKNVADSESGFRVFSRKALDVLELSENGMAVSAETIAVAAEKGLSIIEKPISIKYTKDSSTMHPVAHGFDVLGRVLVMISERRPLFFFGLGGAVLCALGLLAGAKVIYIATLGGQMATGTALMSVLLLIIGILSIFTGIILNILIKWRRWGS